MDLTYSLEELVDVALYDSLDNSSVDSGKPDTHLCTQHQKQCEDDEVLELLASVVGDDDADELPRFLNEVCVDIARASLQMI